MSEGLQSHHNSMGIGAWLARHLDTASACIRLLLPKRSGLLCSCHRESLHIDTS